MESRNGFIPVASRPRDVYTDLEKKPDHPIGATGIPTGFKPLDNLTCGLHRGELIVIGARPAMGKTALCANLAVRACISGERQYSVAMISTDLPVKQMLMRMLALEAKVDLVKLCAGQMESHDLQQVAEVSEKLGDSDMVITGAAKSLPAMLKELTDIKHGESGLDIVIVDDLQSLAARMDIKRSTRGIASLMHDLKAVAQELDVAVIVTSQLSAAVESRADKRPRISDLYQLRAIEQQADVIMLLYREEMYQRRPENEGLAEIIVAKQKNAEPGAVSLVFWAEYNRFEELPEISSDDVDAVFGRVFEATVANLQRADKLPHAGDEQQKEDG